MGQTNSLPSGRFLISSCKRHSVELNVKILETVDLSNLLDSQRGLLNSVFEYQVRFMGGQFTPIQFKTGVSLNEMLKVNLGHFKVKSRCYTVSLENIKKMISNFNVLVAGVVCNKNLSKVFGMEPETFNIVLIVGYTLDSLLIKVNSKDTLHFPLEHLDTIKEIHNISINSNEEIYLDLLSEC